MSEKIKLKFSPFFTVLGDIGGITWTALILILGNIDSIKYCEILQEGLLEWAIGSNSIPFRLQQGNATPHVPAFIRQRLVWSHVTVLPWLAASPNLSRFEMWQVMKDKVEKLQPENIAYWKTVIQETWEEFSQQYTDNTIDSQPMNRTACKQEVWPYRL